MNHNENGNSVPASPTPHSSLPSADVRPAEQPNQEVGGETPTLQAENAREGFAELLWWRCKCHYHLYSSPEACLHTDKTNLVPVHQSDLLADDTKRTWGGEVSEIPLTATQPVASPDKE